MPQSIFMDIRILTEISEFQPRECGSRGKGRRGEIFFMRDDKGRIALRIEWRFFLFFKFFLSNIRCTEGLSYVSKRTTGRLSGGLASVDTYEYGKGNAVKIYTYQEPFEKRMIVHCCEDQSQEVSEMGKGNQ